MLTHEEYTALGFVVSFLFVKFYLELEACHVTNKWIIDKPIVDQLFVGVFDIFVAVVMAWIVIVPGVVIYILAKGLYPGI